MGTCAYVGNCINNTDKALSRNRHLQDKRPKITVTAVSTTPTRRNTWTSLEKSPRGSKASLNSCRVFDSPLRWHQNTLDTIDVSFQERGLVDVSTLKGRIMIVDDFGFNRRFLSLMLQRFGLTEGEIVFAENGQEALKLAAEVDLYIVFMDMNMPVMDGFEATKALRRRAYCACENKQRPLPIIGVSVVETKEQIARMIEAGVTSVSPKCMSVKDLQHILEQFLPPSCWASSAGTQHNQTLFK